MRRLLVLIVVLTLPFTACGDDGSDDESSSDASDTTEVASGDDLPEQVVVFTPDEAEIGPDGEPVTWTPDIDDVLAVEEVLPAFFDAPQPLPGALDDYVRQYIGVGPEDRRLVVVNALCTSAGLDDWESELIVVADGGDCFWQAVVTPSGDDIVSLTVNGEA